MADQYEARLLQNHRNIKSDTGNSIQKAEAGRHNEGRPEKEDALLCQLIRTQKTTLPRVLPNNMCYEACISMDEDIFSQKN